MATTSISSPITKAILWAFDTLPVGAEFYINQLQAKASEREPAISRMYQNSVRMVINRHRREFYHWADRRGKLVKIGE